MTSGRRIDPRLRLVSGQVSSSGPIFAEHVAREGALLNRVAQGNLRDGVTDATIELPRIRSNPTETLQVEDATKQGISVDKSRKFFDRRISVAPMMDWTDDL
jgi:hypothetical protein